MNGFNARRVVKRSAASALFALTLCPHAFGQAPPPAAPTTHIHPESAPFAGTHNYRSQAQPFRYGWFGAEHFYPTNQTHKTYYDDVVRWSRWRRY
ncbi:hypothetical protein Pla123a_10070 [Posidoniimonas polymericola]|uniref:Uncharacterized protein n=1 Tax=Posidoniimonas polymericola TaxID=2528002 RepID=A0A5C5YUH8_9BACT|nr:hypothetical protein [Posidoniimonas polymericola]TWT78217.1 hypothetical protein Pla123a_10070 [Posidoniimonas polymericola]